jgi:hypothetical protein
VKAEDQDEHLRSQHLGPHYFMFNCRHYRTDKPSMLCGDLIKLCDAIPTLHVYERREGKEIYYGHNEAIDLTRKPQLFSRNEGTPYGGPHAA